MTEDESRATSFEADISQPLIAVPLEENGRQMVRYFTDEAAADEALAKRRSQNVRRLAGVWKDLDWDDAVDELDRIRHANRPTPPIELDL